MSKLLTINQAAAILGISTKTLRRWEELNYYVPDRAPYTNIRLYNPAMVEQWKEMLDLSRRMTEHLKKFDPIKKELDKYLVLKPLSPGERLPMMNFDEFSIASNAEDKWEEEWKRLVKEFLKYPDKMRWATGQMESGEK